MSFWKQSMDVIYHWELKGTRLSDSHCESSVFCVRLLCDELLLITFRQRALHTSISVTDNNLQRRLGVISQRWVWDHENISKTIRIFVIVELTRSQNTSSLILQWNLWMIAIIKASSSFIKNLKAPSPPRTKIAQVPVSKAVKPRICRITTSTLNKFRDKLIFSHIPCVSTIGDTKHEGWELMNGCSFNSH